MAGGEGKAAVPLLEKKPEVYFDGCPGCAMDRRKAENPGIPYVLFFHMWIINLVTCMPLSSLFPYLYFMIRDFHIAKRVEDIGFYAGFVGASYMLGRTLTSIIWGILADRIGRKPVIVITICSMLVFNTLFGLSVHYWMAIATRFFLGFLHGSLGTIRAYAVEVSTSWAVALIIGPAIGGYLAQPAEKYPKWFPMNSLFGRFPYFLPSLCLSVFYFVILISSIWLPETLHMHKLEKREDQPADSPIAYLSNSEDSVKQHITSTWSLFKNWPLMSSIVLFCIACFDDMAYTEMFPLWAESNKKYGGLSFSTKDVGSIFVVTGSSILLYQTFVYPRIIKVLGLISTCRVAAILSMVLLLTYPSMANFSRSWLYCAVNIASLLKNNCIVTIVTCSFILQNNSVPQDQRATANGISTTLMSLSKTFAPAGAGIMFSWAQKHQHAFLFPGDQILFFLLAMVVFLEFIWTFKPFLAMAKESSSSSCH
ncbi:hypothetical protein PVAP13_8NG021800 [Panicum virgatum]|uniref:Major facilitator superfamily (MFS) profile domain-containing protein n=1 Tax=Panicum virgatum TaxID=38727 RepID=A0A8T0P672_PANVG|nr:hypothetical protein PVAP13_8NG021800 [Panicum virgatum]